MESRRCGRAWTIAIAVMCGIGVLAAAGGWWLLHGDQPDSTALLTDTSGNDVQAVWFEDVTDAAGIDFTYVRGFERRYWFPEIMGGGAGWFDYDSDGDLDLYLVQGGQLGARSADVPANRLYRNRGDGTFEDVTVRAGVGDRGYGMGCACGDYDADGNVDLYVTNVGPNRLYRNNGDGTFSDVTSEAGVGDPAWGASCAFVDYDGDGDLDLVVINYVNWSAERELECLSGTGERDYCTPTSYNAPAPDTIYRNEGDGTFSDVSKEVGFRRAFGNGLGVACGDFNSDGHIDLYVANDGMPNQLWLNDGKGHFTDEALMSGSAVNMHGAAEAGMGVAAVDVDNDGDLDLFMTHLREQSNTFYLNQGGLFEDTTPLTGLSGPSVPFTGFGMGFADFDNDGQLDLYVANGRVGYYDPVWSATDVYGEPNQLFRGLGRGRFEEVTPRGGTSTQRIATSRAAAFGDYDNDGGVDVVVVNSAGKARLLRNVAASRGHWIAFRVLNERGGDAMGASVRIETDGRVQWRHVHRAYSYCASNDTRVHFGLAQSTAVDEVTVRWPSGQSESFGTMPAGQIHELRKGLR